MNSYNNPFYRSLLGISEIDSVNSANINTQSLTVSSLGSGLVSSTSGTLQNAVPVVPLSFNSNQLSIALTGSTGVTYDIVGNIGRFAFSPLTGPTGPIGTTGPIGPIGYTGYTGPIGLPGVGGTIAYYANYYSTTTQSIGTSAQQITFPNHFVQNGISLDVNNNIVFSASGTYKITTLLQVNGSNNARFNHWYRYNGADVANSAFEDHFSSGAGQVLSTSSGLITVNAGDTLGLWGLKTAGTIDITYTPGSVSPVYPASTSVNVVVSQETYTQIGPTGYTGPQSLITTNTNVFGGVDAGISRTTATSCVGLGYRSLSALTTSLNNTAVGADSLRNFTSTPVPGSNTAVGFASLNQCATGVQNTCIGSGSGRNIIGGRFNTCLGMSSGLYLTRGDTNFHLGLNSGASNLTSNDNISIGAFSMARAVNYMTGPDGRNLAIGHYSSHSLEGYPTNNISIGYNSLYNATQASDNIAIGTNALNSVRTGGGNIAIGGSSTTVGNLTGGQGLNIGLGIASNLYLTGSSSNNIGIGGYSNLNTSSGNNNISIGPATQASTATSSNEITISTNGTISVPVSGRGPNTALIDARNGLYYWNPAICYLYGTALASGWVQWAIWDTGNVPTKGFTLTNNNGRGANTTIEPNFYGHYEITINGGIIGNGSSLFLTLNNINVRQYNIWFQSFSTNGIAYTCTATAFVRPFPTVGLSGFDFLLSNATLFSGGLPLYACIKFIGF